MRCGWSEGSCDTHHIIPKSEGGEYSIENGVILCPNCHRLADAGKINKQELFEIKS
jgi:5-methylcytosine-specific restriction endonuclease McrA